jgi:Zn-dependent peptidase ImmA (M78 family)
VLIPSTELRDSWRYVARAADPFQALASRFKVSPIVAARRALDLRLIQQEAFFSFLRGYEQNEKRKAAAKKSGGDFYLTQEVRIGRRFGEAIIRATQDGRRLYRDPYRLTGLRGATFDRFAEGLGFRSS